MSKESLKRIAVSLRNSETTLILCYGVSPPSGCLDRLRLAISIELGIAYEVYCDAGILTGR